MTQKNKFKNSNNPDDFDLDSYIEEQSSYQHTEKQPQIEHQEEPSFMKNAILGLALLFTGFMWYHDWSPQQAYTSVFGGDDVRIISTNQQGNGFSINIPDIEIPDININENDELNRAIEQEFTRLNEFGQIPAVTDYLVALKDAGLLADDKLSAFQARQLHAAGVPISYIQEVDNAGFLDDLNFVAISEFYKNQIPLSYITQFEEAGFLDKVNFVGISEFYKNNVSMEYLNTLDNAGYLDDLSFVYVTEYFKAGVTPEFLNSLKEKGLYDDLNFIDVVELYKDENN